MSTFQALLVVLALCMVVPAPARADVELADIACESTATIGTGTLDLDGAAVGGYVSLAAAGVTSGATVPYQITTGAGGSRKIETGWGLWTNDTLSRDAIITTDDQTDPVSELALTGTSTVCVGPIAELYRGVYRVGEHFWFTGSSCPNYALRENGATNISREIFADLFEVVGTTYGSDDGTTFGVPNLHASNRFIRAADGSTFEAGNTQTDDNLSHTHQQKIPGDASSGLGAGSTGGGWLSDTGRDSSPGDSFYLTGSNTYARGGTEAHPNNIALTPCIVF